MPASACHTRFVAHNHFPRRVTSSSMKQASGPRLRLQVGGHWRTGESPRFAFVPRGAFQYLRPPMYSITRSENMVISPASTPAPRGPRAAVAAHIGCSQSCARVSWDSPEVLTTPHREPRPPTTAPHHPKPPLGLTNAPKAPPQKAYAYSLNHIPRVLGQNRAPHPLPPLLPHTAATLSGRGCPSASPSPSFAATQSCRDACGHHE